jgi:hypothetical protein
MKSLILRRVRGVVASVAVASVAVSLAACGGDGPNPPPEAISIALSGATLSVQQGQNGTVTATVGRLNGFAGGVTLTLEGLPTGVTGVFNPAPVPASTITSTLTLTVAASAAPGVHALTVRARGTGVTDQTATLTLTVTAAPTLALALNPASLSVQQGQAGTSSATIVRGGSFTGAVDLTAEGVPAGVTVSFNPASIPANATTSTMTVSVTASTAPGSASITVRARGTGVTDQLATLTLTITAAPAYTLTLNPTAASVQQGQSRTVEVTIARSGGFAAGVTLSLEGAPTGVTASFSPNPATGNTSTLTIGVGASAAPGTHPLTVKGTASGLTDRTAAFSLVVTQSGGSGNVSFRFCASGVSELPVWVAYQDDTGPWTRVTAGANNTYSFTITSRGGVAIVRPPGMLEVMYATASELATIGPDWDNCNAAPGTKVLNGTVAGVGASEQAEITLGPAFATVDPPGGSYILDDVPDGALDLIAVRATTPLGAFTTNKLIIRRAVNLPTGSSIPVLDFNGSEAVGPVSANLTINGLGSDEASLFVTHLTATGTDGFLTAVYGDLGATWPYQGVPVSLQASTDLHTASVFTGDPTEGRVLLTAFKAAGNRTVTLGPHLATPTVTTVASAPYARYRMQLPVQSEYPAVGFVTFFQNVADREATIFATAAYVGAGVTVWDLTIPDLTGAAGFDANWGLRPGSPTTWAASAAGGPIFASLTSETTVLLASRFGGPPLASIASRTTFGPQSALRTVRPKRIPAMLWRHAARQR